MRQIRATPLHSVSTCLILSLATPDKPFLTYAIRTTGDNQALRPDTWKEANARLGWRQHGDNSE